MGKILMIVPIAVMAVEPALVGQSAMVAQPTRIVSPGGEYYLDFEYGEGSTEYVMIERFALYTSTGDVVYEKTGMNHTLLDVGDNGIVVGIDFDGPISGRARLVFYDTAGNETGTALVGFLLGRTFAGDGAVYCVNDGVEGVRIFNSRGAELYSLGAANSIACSKDGRTVALARDIGIDFFIDGELVNTLAIPSPFVRQMKFSPSGTLFGYITKKTLTVYELDRDVQLFRYEEAGTDRHFISFDIVPHTAGFVCGLDEDGGRGASARHTTGYLYYIDEHGTVRWQEKVHYDTWNIHVPLVRVESEHTFTVSTVDRVYHYEY